MFTLFTSMFLLAARHSILEEIDHETAMFIYGGVALLFVIYGIVQFFVKIDHKKKQEQMDEKMHRAYLTWHNMISTTGELVPYATDLVLSKGEECLRLEYNVTLYEVRAVRTSTHTFGSMPITRGIRAGRGYSKSESHDEWRPIATGRLYITNKRIYFDGDMQDRKIPLSQLATVKAECSALEISSNTRQKSMIFTGLNGQICRELIQLVIDSREEHEKGLQ